MIIDVHGHLCASPKLYAWFTLLLASRASYGTPPPPFSDDELLALVETRRNLDAIDGAGTDVQFISPRPFTKPAATFVPPTSTPIIQRALSRTSIITRFSPHRSFPIRQEPPVATRETRNKQCRDSR